MTKLKRVEAHVFAGLGGWFTSRGTRALDQLMDDMSPVWDANHWYHGQWEKALQGIRQRVKIHKDQPTIILIGHSYGALRIQQIAAVLHADGIAVHYLAGIDPTALTRRQPPMVITTNVQQVDEFWAASGPPAWARWRAPDGQRGGMYVITKPMKVRHELFKVGGGHIPCASHPLTRSRIVQKVKELVV